MAGLRRRTDRAGLARRMSNEESETGQGGGTAGSVLGRRLVETGAHVLIVEAGADFRSDTPVEFRDGWRLPLVPDWGLESNPSAAGVTERLRRGRLLGGTSWLTRFALRGSASDFDAWAADEQRRSITLLAVGDADAVHRQSALQPVGGNYR